MHETKFHWLTHSNKFPVSQFFSDVTLDPMFKYLVKICVNILFKDLDLALFFILDIKTEKIIEKCAGSDFGFGYFG